MAGWFFDKDGHPARQIRVRIGKRISVCEPCLRPDIRDVFPELKLSDRCGFNQTIKMDAGSRLVILEAELQSGKIVELSRRLLFPRPWNSSSNKSPISDNEQNARLLSSSKLFDKKWYLAQNPDVKKSGMPAEDHYLSFGWKERRDPSVHFSTAAYLDCNKDVAEAGINPLIHYLRVGHAEKRTLRKTLPITPLITVTPSDTTRRRILFVSHDGSKSGAPLLGLNICKQFKKMGCLVSIILLKDGPLRNDFNDIGEVFIKNHYKTRAFRKLLQALYNNGVRDVFLNTIVSGYYAAILKELGYHIVTLVHEMAFSIKQMGLHDNARSILQGSDKIVVPSLVVSTSWEAARLPIPRSLLHVLPQGNYSQIEIIDEEKFRLRKKIRDKFNLPSKTRIILAVANLESRKRPDTFLEVARKIRMENKDCFFIWIGYFDDKIIESLYLRHPMQEASAYCRFIGFCDDISDYYAAADLFFLPSSSDAFPTVVLMAINHALPVLLCRGCTGAADLLEKAPGGMIEEYSTDGFSQEAIRILFDQQLYGNIQSYLRTVARQIPSFRQYVIELLGLISDPIRKVTCIIPNYNYSSYLPQRLESIFQQTYPIFDIVFLDDCSSDNSISIAKQKLNQQPIDYIIEANSTNSGSVFKQWEKGISLAKGDFIWMAEADDFCRNDFVESLIPFFKDRKVNLAYSQSCLVDQDNKVFIENFKVHTNDISKTKWETDYIYSFQQELNLGLAIKNTIPNASAAIMRKSEIASISHTLSDYRVAGDWLFYIKTIEGGRIAYCAKVLNFYRRHSSSVFHKNQERTVREVERIHRHILEHYQINNEVVDKMKDALLRDYQYTQSDFPVILDYDSFKTVYVDSPTIMIFIGELTYGGGEIFPIRLANAIARRGYKTYLLSFDYVPPLPDIVELIAPNVILVHMADVNANGGLRQFILDKKIDYISTHNYHAEKAIIQAIADLPVYWSITMHGIHEHLLLNPNEDRNFKNIFIKAFQRADRIIYAADKNLTSISQLPFETKQKLLKINNGFSKREEKTANRADYGISETDIVLIFAARGIPEKGWEEAILATQALNSKLPTPKYHLLLIGDSDYVRQLQKKHHNSFIHFMGFQSNITPLIQMADAGLLPSYFVSESQPLVIIEFMACGKPCIASSIGEIPQMLTDGNITAGEVVRYKNGPVNVNELADAIRKVTRNRTQYKQYSEAAKEIFKHYDMALCVDRYLSLWEKPAHKKNQ
ncbi:MAG: glycosyltransferase [Opitutaceae bacterium]|nr:glycosyltransferase [Opitutaceae bacterium]